MTQQDDNQPEHKIINFPALEERSRLKKQQKQQDSEIRKQDQDRKIQEDKFRAEYRAQQARRQSKAAQQKASLKEPFFNFGLIPLFTKTIIWVFLLIHIAIYWGLDAAGKFSLYMQAGFIPDSFTRSYELSYLTLLTPITSLFMHGSWMHLAFNIVMMLVMGIFFEREFGFKKIAFFFLVFGLCGNLAYIILSPHSTMPVIGASGAISGLFAFNFLLMQSRHQMGPILEKHGPIPFILLWVSVIIFTGMISNDVSWQSHLGGFLGGVGIFSLWQKGHIRF